MGKIVQNFIDYFNRKIGKNRKVVKILRRDMKKLLPCGYWITARGISKPYQYMSRILLHSIYAEYCDYYSKCDESITIEEARKQINDSFSECWDALFQE